MHVVLKVTSEFDANQKILVRSGQKVNIGRGASNDFQFPNDARMSHEHFSVELTAGECWLNNVRSKNVTTINELPISEPTKLQAGDEIIAGQSCFTVLMEGVSSPAPTPAIVDPVQTVTNESELEETDSTEPVIELPLEGIKASVLAHFRGLGEPLFAILDAARDPLVLALLHQSNHQYESLYDFEAYYEGAKGELLADVTPYLVKLPSDSTLLRTLIDLGWGKSWGVFLTCKNPFNEVRDHFRCFLKVTTYEGKELYFRFYDPRVLRIYLPTCLRNEAEEFFGPCHSFYLEDEDGESVLWFLSSEGGAKRTVTMSMDETPVS